VPLDVVEISLAAMESRTTAAGADGQKRGNPRRARRTLKTGNMAIATHLVAHAAKTMAVVVAKTTLPARREAPSSR